MPLDPRLRGDDDCWLEGAEKQKALPALAERAS